MTLRARLAWILLATLLPLGLAVGVGLYTFVRVSLYARLDDALSARVEALAAAVKWHNGELEFDFEDAAMPQYEATYPAHFKQAAYFEIWRLRAQELGALVERSKSMGSGQLVQPRGVTGGTTRVVTWNMDLADGTAVRVLAMRIVPAIEREEPGAEKPGERSGERGVAANADASGAPPSSDAVPEVLIVVAVPRDSVDRPLDILAVGLVLAGFVLAGAGLVSARWAIAKGLAPVGGLAAQVSAIDAENLGTRLTVPRLPPEISPIQDRMNAVLARIEGAMLREKRFTSAAAHELRTPIAELRMLLEVASSHERTSQQWKRTAERALHVLARAQSLCEALLRLARASENQSPSPDLVPVDVGPLIREQVERAMARHGAGPGLVQVQCASGLLARVDTAMLGSIVGNLVDNALRHGEATAGGPIVIRGSRTQDTIQITISNPAPRIAQDDLAHLFEPFWRKDPSRHDQSGFGLGLAVARVLASAMKGDLSAVLEPPTTLTIHLTLQSGFEPGAATP
jgi:two-component system sensor histidine kinase QseC